MRLHTANIFAGLIACLFLVGCAEKKTDTDLLMERANAYWEAARLFDLITMFHMEAPSLDGRLIAADMTKVIVAPTRLVKYQLKNPKINGESATIDLDLTLVLADAGGKGWDQPTKQDKWSKINGQWYHGLPKPKEAPPKPAAPPAAAPPQGNGAKPAAPATAPRSPTT